MAWFLNKSPTLYERLLQEKKRLEIQLEPISSVGSDSGSRLQRSQKTKQQIVSLELVLVLVVVISIPESGGIEGEKVSSPNGQITLSSCDVNAPRSFGFGFARSCLESAS